MLPVVLVLVALVARAEWNPICWSPNSHAADSHHWKVSEVIIPWWWFGQFSMKSHMSHGKLYWKKNYGQVPLLLFSQWYFMYDVRYSQLRDVQICILYLCPFLYLDPSCIPALVSDCIMEGLGLIPSLHLRSRHSLFIPHTIYHIPNIPYTTQKVIEAAHSYNHPHIHYWQADLANQCYFPPNWKSFLVFHPHFFLICIWCCLIFLNSSLRPCFS